MLESWFQVVIAVLAGVAFAAFGYLVSEIKTSRRNKERNNELRTKTEAVRKVLRKVENQVGIAITGEFFSPHIALGLQDIEKRLACVLQRLGSPRTESYKLDAAGHNAVALSQIIDQDSIDEDNKNWEAYERWKNVADANVPPNDETGNERQLTQLYNEAIDRRELRDNLWNEFRVAQIENVNAVEQRLGNTAKPEFRQSESGNFYAVDNPLQGNFLVVPKFDLTVKQTNYESTIKFIFQCAGFDDGSSYSRVRVIRPAVFIRNGDTWELVEKGELLLSP